MHNLSHTTEELIKALESKGYTITPPKKPTGRMKVLPEIETEYWYVMAIYGTGALVKQSIFDGGCFDLEKFILGNMFHDKESAEQAKPEYIAWLNSTAKVLSKIAELNPEGWEPDWDYCYSHSFIFHKGVGGVYISGYSIHKTSPNNYYMATREIAQHILAEMPEDVERMIKR